MPKLYYSVLWMLRIDGFVVCPEYDFYGSILSSNNLFTYVHPSEQIRELVMKKRFETLRGNSFALFFLRRKQASKHVVVVSMEYAEENGCFKALSQLISTELVVINE